MGCAAGKQVSGSPEVSSSTHVTAVSKEKENGWSPLVSENQRKATKGDLSLLNNKKKDSSRSESSVACKSSLQCPEREIPNTKVQYLATSKPACQESSDSNSNVKKPTFQNRTGTNNDVGAKPVPLGQIRMQMTQSQMDFFKMLDSKINEGPDYISETDTCT